MDNPPAFPTKQFDEDNEEIFYPGMTLRDYATLQVLKGMLANPRSELPSPEYAVDKACEFADAFLTRRETDEQG